MAIPLSAAELRGLRCDSHARRSVLRQRGCDRHDRGSRHPHCRPAPPPGARPISYSSMVQWSPGLRRQVSESCLDNRRHSGARRQTALRKVGARWTRIHVAHRSHRARRGVRTTPTDIALVDVHPAPTWQGAVFGMAVHHREHMAHECIQPLPVLGRAARGPGSIGPAPLQLGIPDPAQLA